MDIVLGFLALSMLSGIFLAVVLGIPAILWREFRLERSVRQAASIPASASGVAQPVPRPMPDGMRAVLRLLEEQRRRDYTA